MPPRLTDRDGEALPIDSASTLATSTTRFSTASRVRGGGGLARSRGSEISTSSSRNGTTASTDQNAIRQA